MTLVDGAWILAAYLCGSLPMGLWIGRARGVDLRLVGSKNIGATNAGRILGRRFFFLVFTLDSLKSFGPVVAAQRIGGGSLAADWLGLATGVAAIVGHVFPLFLRFRGGKGVATSAGVFFALAPLPTAIALATWIVVFAATRFVSLASLVAAVALPGGGWLLRRSGAAAVSDATLGVAVLVAALIVIRHRANIGRLLRGEEPRMGRRAGDGASTSAPPPRAT